MRVVCGVVRDGAAKVTASEIVVHLSMMTYNYTCVQGAHLIGQFHDGCCIQAAL
jgi:hypothetical protein